MLNKKQKNRNKYILKKEFTENDNNMVNQEIVLYFTDADKYDFELLVQLYDQIFKIHFMYLFN